MNIGLFTDCYYPQINGVTVSTSTLKEALESRGHNVYVITVTTPKTFESDPSVIRIPSVPFNKWNDFRVGFMYPPGTLKKIYKLDLDIIHTQTEFGICITGRAIARALRIPVVHTYHTLYEHYSHYLSKHFLTEKFIHQFAKNGTKLYLARCKLVIAPSEKTRDILQGYHVKSPIDIIPSGIKLSNFQADCPSANLSTLRDSLNIKDSDFVILSLGRISQEKSLDVIIKQFDSIKKEISNAKLVVVGDGPYMDSLLELKDSSAYKDDIIFTGQVPWSETGNYYRLADVFISASKTETQGLTIFESLAAKTPAIVRKDENVLSYIEHGAQGLIFDDENDLPEMVFSVYRDNELREKLMANGFETAQMLSAENFGSNVEAAYLKVLGGKQVMSDR